MPAIARLGDQGSHGGVICTAASKTKCEGPLIARLGDLYCCPIHGPNPIVTAASKTKCEGAFIARLGDSTACGAVIVTGASKTFCE
jgi:uncharacterized Zn-binding protein involved in type VI secretion